VHLDRGELIGRAVRPRHDPHHTTVELDGPVVADRPVDQQSEPLGQRVRVGGAELDADDAVDDPRVDVALPGATTPRPAVGRVHGVERDERAARVGRMQVQARRLDAVVASGRRVIDHAHAQPVDPFACRVPIADLEDEHVAAGTAVLGEEPGRRCRVGHRLEDLEERVAHREHRVAHLEHVRRIAVHAGDVERGDDLLLVPPDVVGAQGDLSDADGVGAGCVAAGASVRGVSVIGR
jgi:hypothetical protein